MYSTVYPTHTRQDIRCFMNSVGTLVHFLTTTVDLRWWFWEGPCGGRTGRSMGS